MGTIETFFLDMGFSYTLSKLLPYIFFPVIGLIIWLIVKRWLRKGYVKLIAFILAIIIPFFLYFSLHPIYEGDFSNNSQPALSNGNELEGSKEDKLVVITIPGCPFCIESIDRMKAFKTRHPEVDIEYRVCASDSIAPLAIKDYSKMAEGKFPVIQAKDSKKMMDLAGGQFPSFVLVKKSGNVVWSNDNFGAGGLDEVVARFQ